MVDKEPQGVSSGTPPSVRYRDLPFALLFITQLVAVAAVAISNGKRVAGGLPAAGMVSVDTLRIFAVACCASALFSVGWLALLRSHARSLIWVSAGSSMVLYALTALWLLTGKHASSTALGLGLLLAACTQAFYLYCVRERVAFSAVLLSSVASLIQAHPAMLTVALLALVACVVWTVVWAVAVSFTLHARTFPVSTREDAPGGTLEATGYGAQGGVIFFLLVSFYWTAHVLKNVVHVAVAGTVGSWYFLAPQANVDPTKRALRRALTTSFGSICLGSLVVSVIRALRLGASAASRRTAPGVIRSCLLCALGFLDVLVRFFNQYAFTHVALYGKHFTSASRDTWALLVRCGIDVLVQKDMIGSVLMMGCLVGGLTNTLLLGAWGRAVFDGDVHEWLPVAWIVFLIGAGAQLLVSSVVESAVSALYVCYAEDPNALASVNPELYACFVNAHHAAAPMTPAEERDERAIEDPMYGASTRY